MTFISLLHLDIHLPICWMFCSPPKCLHATTFISFYHHFRRYKDVYGAFRHLILTWGLKLFQLRRQKALSSEITAHWVPHWAHDTRAFYKTCRLPDKKGKGQKQKEGREEAGWQKKIESAEQKAEIDERTFWKDESLKALLGRVQVTISVDSPRSFLFLNVPLLHLKRIK